MRIPIVLVSLLFLSSCAFGNLAQLKLLDPEANDFQSALSAEYLAYADAKSEQGHPILADYFAAKGMQAWHGEEVELESVTTGITAADASRMRAVREALVIVLDEDVTRVVPQQAARAQLLFDCWVKSAAMKEDSALCVEELQSAMQTLEEVGLTLGLVEEKTRKITFSRETSRLESGDVRELTGLVSFVKTAHPSLVTLAGEANSAHEKTLLVRRMQEIRRMFTARGVPSARIREQLQHNEKAVHLSEDAGIKDQHWINVTARVFIPKTKQEGDEE